MHLPITLDDSNVLSEMLTLLNDSNDSNDNNDSDTSSSASTPPTPLPAKTAKPKKDRRRKEGPVVYSTDLQRRKKAELRSLRAESQHLNAKLQQLLQSRLHRIAAPPEVGGQHGSANGSAWYSLAIIESEKRERSKRTNRELKELMAKQLKLHTSIRRLLERSDATKGVEIVLKAEPTANYALRQVDFSEHILVELAKSLDKLRLQADRVIPTVGDALAVSCRSQHKHHHTRHYCVETSSVTPMACGVQRAGELLWHHITTKRNKDAEKSFRFVRTRDSDCLERNCMASLRDGNDSHLHLDGVNIVRKYNEANRIMLVGTTTWFLPAAGLQFEDHHWTIISPSPTDPVSSVVQSCYQLQVKNVDFASVVQADFEHAQEVVMTSIGQKLRSSNRQMNRDQAPEIFITSPTENNMSYSTMIQHRKKAEIIRLRQQVEELEQLLCELQHRHWSQSSKEEQQCSWFDRAMTEKRRQLHSEKVNQTLKGILRQRQHIERAFSTALMKRDLLKGLDFVAQLHPMTDKALPVFAFSDVVLTGLAANVADLYTKVDLVIPPQSTASVISSRTCQRRTEALDDMIESSSTTALSCSVSDSANLFWITITTKSDDSDKTFRFERLKGSTVMERNCVLNIKTSGQDLIVTGTNIIRRFDAADQAAFVGMTTWLLPEEGLRFEDRLWTRIAPGLENASVMQSCYQIRTTRSNQGAATYKEKVTLAALSKKLRHVMDKQQNFMLDRCGLH